MNEQEAKDSVQELISMIHQQPGWSGGINVGQKTRWFGRALSAAALLSEGGTPEYVTGYFSEDGGMGVLHAFYGRSVITIRLEDGHEEEPKLTVTGRTRSGLRSLEVAVSDPIASGTGNWPGAVDVLAVYEDGRQLKLPVTATGDDYRRAELAAFVPSLRADLSGGE